MLKVWLQPIPFTISTVLPPAKEVWGNMYVCSKGEGGLPTGDGVCIGGSASRGMGVCLQGGWWEDPPELEKRAVRILLECFPFMNQITRHKRDAVYTYLVPVEEVVRRLGRRLMFEALQ